MLEGTVEIPKVKPKRDWRMPNYFGQSRLLAGGDWRAGALLYRINQVWLGSKKKLRRCGGDWIAMPRVDWARSAGLSESEIKNYALPKLKAFCADFLTFQAWKLKQDGPKMLWVSMDREAMYEKFAFLDEVAFVVGTPNYHEPVAPFGPKPKLDEDGFPILAKPTKKKVI